MLASEMTDGQIDDLANKLRDAARKHRGEINKDHAQEALRSDNIGMRLFAVFRAIVEEISRQVVHIVMVDRTRTPRQALDVCGRRQYVDQKVAAAMPRGTGEKVKLTYFKPRPEAFDADGRLSPQKLDDEYKFHGLKPDPQAQIDDNAANPAFTDETPNACQWVDKDGKYCCATFGRWRGGRDVRVDRDDDDWVDGWSFGGVPDESSASAV